MGTHRRHEPKVRAAESPIKGLKEVHMDNDNVSGYDVPVDPMDLLQCDSCQ